jgi:CHAD domain-containing protein
MKAARELFFESIGNEQDAVRFVLRVRFAEALEKQSALGEDDNDAVHAFRLACKRLRYAIERFDVQTLQRAAEALKRVTDELGTAHDCVVLARRASDCGADVVARRALFDRNRYVRRGTKAWREAFAAGGAFSALAEYAGFHWSTT